MIKYGLKLWSNNIDYFVPAVDLLKKKEVDFIELYYNDMIPLDLKALKNLKGSPVNIHSTDNHGFEKFVIGERELSIWLQIKDLAEFFESKFIIVHPGREHTFNTFKKNLKKINTKKILIENMPGLDIKSQPMYASKLSELEEINQIKDICYDFEKAVKGAVYHGIDYKEYISNSLLSLKPDYFHISGGDTKSAIDEHLNLWEGDIDFKWIKQKILELSSTQTIFLVFEVPKKDGLKNDLKNIEYFRNLI